MAALQMRAVMDILVPSRFGFGSRARSDPKRGTGSPIAAGWEGSFRRSSTVRCGAMAAADAPRPTRGSERPVQRRRRGSAAPPVTAGGPAAAPHPRRDRRARSTWSAPGGRCGRWSRPTGCRRRSSGARRAPGKTTLAQVIAATTSRAFEQLSAVSATVKDVREVMERARDRLGERDQGTILFLDEIHRFNKAQQDALLPSVEDGPADADRRHHREPVLRGEPAAAQPRRRCSASSRSDRDALRTLAERGLEAEGATADPDALDAPGRPRRAATAARCSPALEVAVALALERRGRRCVTLDDAEDALGTSALRYGRDDHYDVIRPSSRASGAPTPTPACTGWPACSRPGRTPGSSPAGW